MDFIQPLSKQLYNYWIGFIKLLPQLGLALIVIILTAILASYAGRLVKYLLNTARMRPALTDLIQTLAGVAVWVLGLLFVATILFPSVTPAQAFGALGIGGIAIGLAFRDIFENFMAGVMIMVRKPMRIGDTIEVNDILGRVEQITIRDTYIRKLSNELILVPNSMLFKNAVDIKTDRDLRRYDIVVGVAYGENADEARDVIQQAVESVEGIKKDKGVEVYAREFASSSIDYTVRWWAGSTQLEMHQFRSKVVLAIKAALNKADIEIPFPYRTLTFSEPLQLHSPAKANGSSKPDGHKSKR